VAEAMSTSAREEVAALDAGLPDDLWWSFTGGLDTCFSEHDGEYRNCCMRAGLAYALKVREQQLRAAQPQLTDEYGVRTTYVSGTMSEQPVSDNAEDANALIAEAEVRGRADVVSRELLVRGVEEWRKAAGR